MPYLDDIERRIERSGIRELIDYKIMPELERGAKAEARGQAAMAEFKEHTLTTALEDAAAEGPIKELENKIRLAKLVWTAEGYPFEGLHKTPDGLTDAKWNETCISYGLIL